MSKDGKRSIFGDRLYQLRKQRGLTQTELGEKVGLSKRMIAYYEKETERLSAEHLIKFARALNVSADQLLGIKTIKDNNSPKTARLLNKLKRIETIPEKDKRAVLNYLDALIIKNQSQKQAAG